MSDSVADSETYRTGNESVKPIPFCVTKEGS